jgi:hypothetical protein
MSTTASVAEDLGAAAGALRAYAADTADIQARLDLLRLQAADLASAGDGAQDEATLDELDTRGGELSAESAALIAEWEAAQLRCANALRALSGAAALPSYSAGMTFIDPGPTTIVTPPAPIGPLLEGYPIDETPPGSTVYPVIPLGPQVLINVPAPPTTGVVDGPGSFPPPLGGSIIFDTSADQTGPDPIGGVPEPVPTPEEKRIHDLGQDPATGGHRPSESDTAARLETARGVTLTRAPAGSSADWVDENGTSYDAVGNFPPEFFDRQWPQLQHQIVRHLDKADLVPVDVSRFEPGQAAQVRQFIEDNHLGPRVFVLE